MCSSAGHTTCLVRGSPIRTSSDQRSVDSSPRLIAASYVLHRLLVPRHPPCALNNLATQKTAHPPPEGKRSVRPYTNSCYRVRRCSRPLCSSQRTTGARPHPAASPPTPTGAAAVRQQIGPETKQQLTTRLPGRVRSLRTQQRAYDPGHPRPAAFPTRLRG